MRWRHCVLARGMLAFQNARPVPVLLKCSALPCSYRSSGTLVEGTGCESLPKPQAPLPADLLVHCDALMHFACLQTWFLTSRAHLDRIHQSAPSTSLLQQVKHIADICTSSFRPCLVMTCLLPLCNDLVRGPSSSIFKQSPGQASFCQQRAPD